MQYQSCVKQTDPFGFGALDLQIEVVCAAQEAQFKALQSTKLFIPQKRNSFPSILMAWWTVRIRPDVLKKAIGNHDINSDMSTNVEQDE
jgi:hypothetical protein